MTQLFLNETEFFNFYKYLLDRHLPYGYLGAENLSQSGTVELASKTFSTSNTWPETSHFGNTNYTGPILMQFL